MPQHLAPPSPSISLSHAHHPVHPLAPTDALTAGDLAHHLTPYDIKRLESYANNMLDFHVIMDMLPTIAAMYFAGKFGAKGDGECLSLDIGKKGNLPFFRR